MNSEASVACPWHSSPQAGCSGCRVASKAEEDVASRAVGRILADLTDRRGLRQEWEEIDEATQVEISAAWERIIREELAK